MLFRSLYIHIPFCAKICDYCAFYTVEKADATVKQRFLDRLDQELSLKRDSAGPLDTIYMGGGTPTLFSNGELEKLLKSVNKHFSFAANHEFTIEGTPETITKEKVQILLDGGVNRFSMGVQSFSVQTRATMGRPGNVKRVGKAIEFLNIHQVDNFNCDLIYGVSTQSLTDWRKDLEMVLSFNPSHVSTYSLTIEENTILADKGRAEVHQDSAIEMWDLATQYLEAKGGYNRYEVSNFCKPGYECKHNLMTWQGQAFLGAGPSACYFDGVSRWKNPGNLTAWLKGNDPEEDSLKPQDRAVEILITGLRVTRGWSREHFNLVTGFDFFDLRKPALDEFMQTGHMVFESDRLSLTPKGILVADFISSELL